MRVAKGIHLQLIQVVGVRQFISRLSLSPPRNRFLWHLRTPFPPHALSPLSPSPRFHSSRSLPFAPIPFLSHGKG
jgi:hypothetical protein